MASSETKPTGLPSRLRTCELFAGIGGWRVALEAVLPDGVQAEIAAYDSGPHCSEVYALNFEEQCSRRNIEQLELSALEGFDLWAMSPPCQPFSTTKEAKQRDVGDKRCKALGHLCGVLPRLTRPPRWIILENVKGFYGSEACERWRTSLAEAGYSGLEFLLDLASFGTPNHRTRYYLLAERSSRLGPLLRGRGRNAGVETAEEGEEDAEARGGSAEAGSCGEATGGQLSGDFLPPGVLARGPWAERWRHEIDAAHRAARASRGREEQEAAFRHLRCRFCEELASAYQAEAAELRIEAPETLAGVSEWKLLPLPRSRPDAFLVSFDADRGAGQRLAAKLSARAGAGPDASWSWVQSAAEEARPIAEYLLEEESLSAEERAELLVPLSVLEKPYARGLSYVEPRDVQSFCFTGHYGKVLHKSSGSLLHLPGRGPLDRNDPAASHGSVRFFSPKEVLCLLGFPRDFRLPPELELRHRYKVVGNSIAVTVATALLRLLLLGEDSLGLYRLRQEPPLGAAADPASVAHQ